MSERLDKGSVWGNDETKKQGNMLAVLEQSSSWGKNKAETWYPESRKGLLTLIRYLGCLLPP